jgi:phosphocarrier protein
MEKHTFRVPWSEGLHMRRAARLTQIATRYRSEILLRAGRRIANARNILAILILCATVNAAIDVEVAGSDEREAMEAVQIFFDDAA